MTTRISRQDLAARIAADIPEGSYVNLGIGAPTLVANYLPEDQEIILHTENGMLGMGPAPEPGSVDPDLINAGKQAVTALAGAAYFHHADSFPMMRGGHPDGCVLHRPRRLRRDARGLRRARGVRRQYRCGARGAHRCAADRRDGVVP